MRPRYVDKDSMNILRTEEGYIDVFQKLVKYDPKYDNVVGNQLGNILVALDLDNANRIARKIQNRYRIVTLDGEIINTGGSITGGSLQTTKSILSYKQELETLKKRKQELKTIILEIDSSLEDLESKRKTLEEEYYTKKQMAIEKNETIRNILTTRTNKNSQLEDVLQEINSLEHVVDSTLSSEEEKMMETYSKKVDEKNAAMRTLEKITLQKDRLQQEIEEAEAENKVGMSELRKLEQQKNELEVRINKIDMQLDHHLNILNEEYSMTYENAKQNYPLELEEKDAKEKVALYKSILRKIGMVNIDAIEEFERVNERYTFLTNQKDDLRQAKEALFEIIAEMDDVMKEEFSKTFELIREEFQTVFKQLFAGGYADLKLTDPANILETGIDIVASPPGKKLTTITLLSGGEKTLTAISLLFAILNVRTVPFCLFDEVEAALDEANVDNFGNYLNSYKDKTQFLLITHKKKTMEYAKTLYGITMQESGVSKLVSVQFEKLEKIDTL